MRFLAIAAALFASVALAQQNNAIAVPEGQSTLDITAGQDATIQWTNPSSGDVTIKIQESGNGITPDSGTVLASGVPASVEQATVSIPADLDPTKLYTIEIIDESNPDNINFSPNFGAAGATGTSTGSSTASATDSTITGSTTTDSSSTTTATDSTTTTTDSTTTTTDSSSSTSASETSAATSAPDANNGAVGMKVQGGLVAAVAVAVAIL